MNLNLREVTLIQKAVARGKKASEELNEKI
jgi:hypothetical protein